MTYSTKTHQVVIVEDRLKAGEISYKPIGLTSIEVSMYLNKYYHPLAANPLTNEMKYRYSYSELNKPITEYFHHAHEDDGDAIELYTVNSTGSQMHTHRIDLTKVAVLIHRIYYEGEEFQDFIHLMPLNSEKTPYQLINESSTLLAPLIGTDKELIENGLLSYNIAEPAFNLWRLTDEGQASSQSFTSTH